MNEDMLRRSLREAAGAVPATDGTWDAIVDEAGRRRRPGAGLHRFRVVAAAAAVVVLAAAGVVAVRRDDGADPVRPIVVGVPSVTGGSADLIVESDALDDQGGYQPVPEGVAAEVSTVEGVDQVVGVVRTVARLGRPGATARTPSVVVSWDGGDGFDLADGRAPAAPGEIALTPLAARRLGAAIGDQLVDDTGAALAVVGTFRLPGDGPDVVLGAVELTEARILARRAGFTRLHVRVDDGADPEAVRDGIVAIAPPGYRVVGVNQLGTTGQLRDELEIQQSYFDLMSADSAVRTAAVEGAVDDEASRAGYERFRDQAALGTLRIQRFSFVDTDHAEVVYAIYYGPNRSPVVTAPQRGRAVRVGGRWKLSRTTLCGLANLVRTGCDPGDSKPTPPPDGWAEPDTEPDLVAAFRTMGDPRSSLEERLVAVLGGDGLRAVVRAGLRADQRYAGKVNFLVSGVRRTDRGAQILYSVQAEGDPPLETPYPVTGDAVLDHGRWKVSATYACGLVGLVNQSCPADATVTTSSTTSTTSTSSIPPPDLSTDESTTTTVAPTVETTP